MNVYEPASISDETQAFNAEIERILAEQPMPYDQDPAQTRAARERGEGPFPTPPVVDEAEWREVPGARAGQRVRVMVPSTVNGIYLHVHGGGWTFGAPAYSDVRNWHIANALSVAVVSVEYRLAPEHPWPAGADDCEAAAKWLIENCVSEFGTDVIAIGGESAGAHLSAVTLLRMRDKHGYTGFRAANLVYGLYDMTYTPSVRNWGDRYLVLSTPIIDWFVGNVVPEYLRSRPEVSPFYADLGGLPPALFTVGTLDPLLDDSTCMHARWLAAGNEAELAVWPGGVHGFDAFPIGIAKDARTRMDEFLARHMDRRAG